MIAADDARRAQQHELVLKNLANNLPAVRGSRQN
jgi:hypothetical protein